MRVTIYSKPACPLCEEARELLDEAARQVPFELEVVDIYSEQALFDRYRYRVPVIRIGNKDTLELRFTLDELLRALKT